LITNNNETAYREEVRVSGKQPLTQRQKKEEMILDFRKQQGSTPLLTGQQWRRWKVLSSSAYTSRTN
jgi:hypothetical protein